jgi:hypothetical protein
MKIRDIDNKRKLRGNNEDGKNEASFRFNNSSNKDCSTSN